VSESTAWPVASLPGAILLLASVVAAAAADPERGLQLSRGWCASCHLVEAAGAASDAAPPFIAISNDPAITPERLRAWLAKPHPPMPDLPLTRAEEDDILAYIMSLKSR